MSRASLFTRTSCATSSTKRFRPLARLRLLEPSCEAAHPRRLHELLPRPLCRKSLSADKASETFAVDVAKTSKALAVNSLAVTAPGTYAAARRRPNPQLRTTLPGPPPQNGVLRPQRDDLFRRQGEAEVRRPPLTARRSPLAALNVARRTLDAARRAMLKCTRHLQASCSGWQASWRSVC